MGAPATQLSSSQMPATPISADPVLVLDYDPRWPALFAAEVQRIAPAFAEFAPRIEHIGSTSVTGLAAKPVIDILIGLPQFAALRDPVSRLASHGYEYVPAFEAMLPGRRFFRRVVDGMRTHHVHVVQWQGADWQRYLGFRAALRADAVLRDDYAALKRQLALRHRHDRDAYTAGKTSFVTAALAASAARAAA